MPRGETQVRQAQDDLQALVGWLHGMTGGHGSCPSESEIAAHFRVSKETVGKRMQRAVKAGMIRLYGTANWKRPRRVEIMRRDVPPPPQMVAPVVRAHAASGGAFAAWLANAGKGDRHTYFSGHLAEERGKPQGQRDQAGLDEAAAAGKAEADGLVLLATQRTGETLAYMAIRTSKPLRVTA